MKRASLVFTIIAFCLIACSDKSTPPKEDPNSLIFVSPEDVGYSSSQLEQAKQLAEQSGYTAMMALYDGKVFFHVGDLSINYKCHSIRKPFLGALYGIHISEGVIDINKSIEDLDIDDISPSLTSSEKQATIKDLLMSKSGIYHEAAAETQEMKDTRPERGSHAPGTFYYYNNWDFNALGTIFEQETGTKIFEDFETRIAIPIGMEDFSVSNCYNQYETDLSIHPAYSFRMSARDMARFGVLYQQKGFWKGERIIPANWIEESTTTYSIVDSTYGIGYGYLWNTIPANSQMGQIIGSEGYFHTGIGVHLLLILPDEKLVIVQRYDTDDEWNDPGEIGMQIGLIIINSKVD